MINVYEYAKNLMYLKLYLKQSNMFVQSYIVFFVIFVINSVIKLEPEQIEIRDVRDHAVAAIDVFALAIKALKENLEQHLIKRIEFSRENIRWVLTVPGLRDFNAEEFMKKCAEKVCQFS